MRSVNEILEKAQRIDEGVINNKESSILDKADARGRLMGRKFIIGSFSGVVRLVVNAVQLPFAILAATFSLLLAISFGISSLFVAKNDQQKFKDIAVTNLLSTSYSLKYSFHKVINLMRSVVEIIPLTGILLAYYDIATKKEPINIDFDFS